MSNIEKILLKKLSPEEYTLVKEYIENLEKIAEKTTLFVEKCLKPLSDHETFIMRSSESYSTDAETEYTSGEEY